MEACGCEKITCAPVEISLRGSGGGTRGKWKRPVVLMITNHTQPGRVLSRIASTITAFATPIGGWLGSDAEEGRVKLR